MATIHDIYELANAVGGKLYRGYSGRGMFGEQCIGVTVDDSADVLEQAALMALPRPRIDSLGLQYICYWPSISDDEPAAG